MALGKSSNKSNRKMTLIIKYDSSKIYTIYIYIYYRKVLALNFYAYAIILLALRSISVKSVKASLSSCEILLIKSIPYWNYLVK